MFRASSKGLPLALVRDESPSCCFVDFLAFILLCLSYVVTLSTLCRRPFVVSFALCVVWAPVFAFLSCIVSGGDGAAGGVLSFQGYPDQRVAAPGALVVAAISVLARGWCGPVKKSDCTVERGEGR